MTYRLFLAENSAYINEFLFLTEMLESRGWNIIINLQVGKIQGLEYDN